jgi:hypothetical protein
MEADNGQLILEEEIDENYEPTEQGMKAETQFAPESSGRDVP